MPSKAALELQEQILEQEKFQDAETINRIENEYNKELEQGNGAAPSTVFSFGVTLSLSPEVNEKVRGVHLLEKLVREIINKDKPLACICLYYISIAHLRMGKLDESRAVCERLMRIDPDYAKAKPLHELIRSEQQRVSTKQLETAAVATTIGVAAVGVLTMLLRAKK